MDFFDISIIAFACSSLCPAAPVGALPRNCSSRLLLRSCDCRTFAASALTSGLGGLRFGELGHLDAVVKVLQHHHRYELRSVMCMAACALVCR